MLRTVQPEILDHLPHDDPAAKRSRRDLRAINAIMGNHRWLRRQVRAIDRSSVIELGAGDGRLARAIAEGGVEVTALDRAPRPDDLPEEVIWWRGDFFTTLGKAIGDTLVACLILHHFEPVQLRMLGARIQASSVRRIIAVEPHRSRLALIEARVLFPFVNHVTRHDMPTSIRAGFRPDELAPLLGLDPGYWSISESLAPFGAYRFVANRLSTK